MQNVFDMDDIETAYCPFDGQTPQRKVDEYLTLERLIDAFKKDQFNRKWARTAIFVTLLLACINFSLLLALTGMWAKNADLLILIEQRAAIMQHKMQVKDNDRGADANCRN